MPFSSRRSLAVAWMTPIAQSPWAVATTLLLIVGFTSRRMTTPLVQVTEAAEAVAESKPHAGAAFYFTLPSAKMEAKSA